MTTTGNDERTRRYGDALLGAWVPQEYVRRVMAVADAEQAELRRGARMSDTMYWANRAEAAEAKVARVVAVIQGGSFLRRWAGDIDLIEVDAIRAALDGDDE